jgi:hypothetical protein
MGKLTEADDVDLFVGGVEPDAEAAAVARLIEECKKYLDYLRKAASAEEVPKDGVFPMPLLASVSD